MSAPSCTLFIASDHAGFAMKSYLAEYLRGQGHHVEDLGPSSPESCDYPDSATRVTAKVLENVGSFGILICGSGIGMSMAANRVPDIRAALATCEFHAKTGRAHNNANVLCLGERVTGLGLAVDIVDVFLSTPFEGGRHLRRIEKFIGTH